MLPIIVAGVVGVAALAGGVYKYTKSKKTAEEVKEPKSLGGFAVWGQPDTGKTTFIARLRGLEPTGEKEQTTSLRRFGRFELKGVDGGPYEIKELVDMPGSKDRLSDWLEQVSSKDYVFYIVDLSNLDSDDYRRKIKFDVERTVERLAEIDTPKKRVNIIGTHLDKSVWNSVDAARVNNSVLQDARMREIRELFGKVAGYVYSVNLMDKKSSIRLLQDIANDCKI
jgi:GTPase SAR1 family protein